MQTMTSSQFEASLDALLSNREFQVDDILIDKRNVVIFGAGNSGRHTFSYLRKHHPNILIKFFVDSNIEKHGSHLYGTEITSIDAIRPCDVVLIASDFAIEIAMELRNRGVSEYYYFGFCDDYQRWHKHFNSKYILESKGDIVKVSQLLEDDESRQVLYGLIAFRCTLDPKELRFSNYPEYLHPKVLPCANDIIIDGGGYTGDTAQYFLDFLDGQARVYSFECDLDNYTKLKLLAKKYAGKLFPHFKALWSEKTSLQFSTNLNHFESKIVFGNHQNSTEVEAVALDDQFNNVSINFIKLDVEGAEMHVIDGASNILASRKSGLSLAISAYHLPSDLWKIPLRLKDLSPNLHIFMGHHSQKFMASVCYASLLNNCYVE